jgi:hypothetical protein
VRRFVASHQVLEQSTRPHHDDCCSSDLRASEGRRAKRLRSRHSIPAAVQGAPCIQRGNRDRSDGRRTACRRPGSAGGKRIDAAARGGIDAACRIQPRRPRVRAGHAGYRRTTGRECGIARGPAILCGYPARRRTGALLGPSDIAGALSPGAQNLGRTYRRGHSIEAARHHGRPLPGLSAGCDDSGA